MADDGFVTAVGPDKKKRRVPLHYLENPALGYKLPPSQQVREPATPATKKRAPKEAAPTRTRVTEPATPETEEDS